MDSTEIETRGWTAYATMMNEAQALEASAKRLRESAAELHRALDQPPVRLDCPSCDGKGAVDYGYTCLQCGGSGVVDGDGFAVFD